MDIQNRVGDGLMIVKIPTISIETERLGLLSGITITSLAFSGSIFTKGDASIVFYEVPRNGAFYNVWDMGGKWVIYFDGNPVWTGYAMDVRSERLGKLMKRSVSLVDQTEAWNVLVKDKMYPASPNPSYTVGDLISDLANDGALASGVPLENLPDNSTLLSDILDGGVYTIRSSTYLAELQKVLTWVGYKLYADPYNGSINIIDPNNTPATGSLPISFNSENLLSAGFDMQYSNIATTVVVGDKVSGKAVAYGYLADTSDTTNFDIRKLEKVAFATTFGVKEDKLKDIAKNIFDLSRRGSQTLSLSVAGYYTTSLLWNSLSWIDANGNAGNYKISRYAVNVTPQEITTSLEAIL